MNATSDLAHLRAQIERIDDAIVTLIAQRARFAREVGEAKRGAGLPVLDHAREAAVVRNAVEAGRELGLEDSDDLRQVIWQLIGLCRRAQMRPAHPAPIRGSEKPKPLSDV